MKQPITLLTALCLSLTLSACGGGGGGDGGGNQGGSGSASPLAASTTSSSSTNSAPANPAPTLAPAPPAPTSGPGTPAPQVQNIESLSIAADNNLASTYQVTVDVNLTQLAGKQAYIAICPNSGASIEYEKCVVKASLDDGIGSFDLTLPNHLDALVAEITPMEANSSPLIYTWDFNNQAQNTWLIP
ncbi:hypothetical protein [Vibrio rhodolitus]|uniref:hypothetical protein n=1 Tax=Vibrio rhodolitus TaxID=2231649 RepID=UPI000E0BF42A|nr:hypothetical protein [Vibrio rhodolitus]